MIWLSFYCPMKHWYFRENSWRSGTTTTLWTLDCKTSYLSRLFPAGCPIFHPKVLLHFHQFQLEIFQESHHTRGLFTQVPTHQFANVRAHGSRSFVPNSPFTGAVRWEDDGLRVEGNLRCIWSKPGKRLKNGQLIYGLTMVKLISGDFIGMIKYEPWDGMG